MCPKNNMIQNNMMKHTRPFIPGRVPGSSGALAVFPFGKQHFSFTSDSFNQAVCSWNIDRLLHKPSHSGQDAETSITPSPSCLKQLLHC